MTEYFQKTVQGGWALVGKMYNVTGFLDGLVRYGYGLPRDSCMRAAPLPWFSNTN